MGLTVRLRKARESLGAQRSSGTAEIAGDSELRAEVNPGNVVAQSSVQRSKKKEKRQAERLSLVSGGGGGGSHGNELGHGGGFGHRRGEKRTGEGEEDGG